MGWFDEQIKLRKEQDNQVFSDSFEQIANSITGKKTETNVFEMSQDAIKMILKFYGYKCTASVPAEVTDVNEQIDYLCRPFGVMHRQVKLTEGWYKDSIGALLGYKKDGTPVALIPDIYGYKYSDNGKVIKVNKKSYEEISDVAVCFYKPYPNRKLNLVDLVRYAIETRSVKDMAMMLGFMAISSGISLLMPKISYFLYSEVIKDTTYTLLFSTLIFYICFTISNLLFSQFQSMYNRIVSTKMSISVQAATMMRVLSLPASFFRKYASGELSQRASYLSNLCSTLMDMVFSTGFSSLFSLVYVFSIFEYAPSLVIPSLVIIVVTVVFSVITTLMQQKISKANMEVSTKLSGMSYSMLSGIRKIRISGSEKRAFARWANLFAKQAKNQYNPPMFVKVNGVISSAISITGTIVMYYVAIKSGISMAEYNAFNSAYGMVYGAFSSLASIALSVSQIKPVIDMAKPIMDTEPEVAEKKEIVTKVTGSIEFDNVYFKYTDNMPYVVNNMTLKIKPNQYIAIVGKTGCGKSTLIRLLLGFEKPEKGSIYFDGKDLNSIDLKSMRKKIGVVMQDGKLFQGDIFSNITISAPWLTLDDAWEAAEIAGIADDIRDMPMGMHTLITEGSGGISGGQRQRLLIARAIAAKPKILIFDEATSALDNITQKKISESLDNLHCTRIVIAHRLSTIRHCDRILYLEGGQIKEDGTYDELIAKNGLFAELVERQRLDTSEIAGKNQ